MQREQPRQDFAEKRREYNFQLSSLKIVHCCRHTRLRCHHCTLHVLARGAKAKAIVERQINEQLMGSLTAESDTNKIDIERVVQWKTC